MRNKNNLNIYLVINIMCRIILVVLILFWIFRYLLPRDDYQEGYVLSVNNELRFEKMIRSGEIIGAGADLTAGDMILVRYRENAYINHRYPYNFIIARVVSKTAYGDPVIVDKNGEKQICPLYKCYVGEIDSLFNNKEDNDE